jgi:hypothetical protein
VTVRHEASTGCWKSGAERLALCGIATNLYNTCKAQQSKPDAVIMSALSVT